MIVSHSILPITAKKFMIAAGATGVVGEIFHDKAITGSAGMDVAIKIILPLITGILAPLVQEWIETRRHRRQQKSKKL